MVALSLSAELLIMIASGIALRKLNLVKDEFSGQLSAFLMNIALPCLVFRSMTSLEFTIDMLKNCGIALILSIAVLVIQFCIGQGYFLLLKKSGSGRIARYGMTITHFSFMGIPVMNNMFGDVGNLYYAVFITPVRIAFYALSKRLLISPELLKESDKKTSYWKTFVSPGIVVIPVAFLFWVMNWSLPLPLANCVKSLSATCSPMGLVLCGVVLGKYDFKRLLQLKYFKLPLVRTLIMPAIFIILTRPLAWFGIDRMITDMVVIYTALPIASLTASFIVQYDPDPEIQFEAASCVLIATLISTITIPAWYFVLQLI